MGSTTLLNPVFIRPDQVVLCNRKLDYPLAVILHVCIHNSRYPFTVQNNCSGSNAPSPIFPTSRTYSRLISQLSSYGISLAYRYSDKKTIDTKLNVFDASSNCVHNAEGSKDSHRRVNLMNFHHHFIEALVIFTYNIR